MRAGSSDLTEAGLVPPVRYRSHDEDSAHWLDWLANPRDDVCAHLSAQAHRRFIKTHTPLDGLPCDERVTYIVVARHPLDMAVSLYHQGDNLNRQRLRELTGQPAAPTTDLPQPTLPQWP